MIIGTSCNRIAKGLFFLVSILMAIQISADPIPKPPNNIAVSGSLTSSPTAPCTIANPITSRLAYEKPIAILPNLCKNIMEPQTRQCVSNEYTKWSGTYNYPTCEEISADTTDGPLWQISSLSYQGGFRIDSNQHGPNMYSSADFSFGIFSVSEDDKSIFIVGNTAESQIAEFKIPEIVNTNNIAEMVKATEVIQEFSILHDPDGRYDTGIPGFLRLTGMLAIDGKLIVNYFNWYDANGTETDTTAVYSDANNLATCEIIGPFQFEGAARGAGWISPIPPSWQARLGGTHVSGWSQGSINSRLSNGPSAYIWKPYEEAINKTIPGPIPADAGLTFPLTNILYDKAIYGDIYNGSYEVNDLILKNTNLDNNLWTYLSGATFGFIIPNTNTYVTLGVNGGITSGIAYKYEYPDGTHCAGNCPKDPTDLQNYYWLWRLTDIEDAINGKRTPYSIRPYDFGELNTIGSKARLAGGSYNPETGRLIISLREGDDTSLYRRPPLFLVYQVGK